MALKIGMEYDNEKRIRSGIKYALLRATYNGHCAVLYDNLVTFTRDLLVVSEDAIDSSLINMKAKEEIDKMEFSSTNGLVTVKINGKKEILEVKIENDSDFSSDDLEMLQDMIVIATNDAMKQVDKVTEEKMGRFSSIPGLF